MPDVLRLAVGTLTRLPVPPPSRVSATTAAGAMLAAPLVGGVLGLVVGGLVALTFGLWDGPAAPALLGVLAISALAYLTRGLHWDGLADTADALGSGRSAQQALLVARRSDIGPFGVLALALTALAQAAAYAGLVLDGSAIASLVIAAGSSRLAITMACLRGIPAARPEGLGSTVAGTVPRLAGAALAGLWLLACTGLSVLSWPDRWWAGAAAVVVALLVGAAVVRTARTRLGGITGDVLGASVELAMAAALVILVVTTTG